jgi:predicted glycogen debranching enzyme
MRLNDGNYLDLHMNIDGAENEWLETDQLGGYSSGTHNLIPTRRYHALFVSADQDRNTRQVLLAHPLVEIKLGEQWHALSSFRFADGTIHPQGTNFIQSFSNSIWPTWIFKIGEFEIRFELLLLHQRPEGILRWTISAGLQASISLRIRPFLSFRDHNSLSYFDQSDLATQKNKNQTSFSNTKSNLAITFHSSAMFISEPQRYYNFYYQEEQNRGYDSLEDLLSPGFFLFNNLEKSAQIHFYRGPIQEYNAEPERCINALVKREHRRRVAFTSKRAHALSQFEIKNLHRTSLIAGYPWFAEWGRDTFISLRGIAAYQKDYSFCKQALISWQQTIQHGLIPNRFPEAAESAEFNSVDATLWYLIVLGEFLAIAKKNTNLLNSNERKLLLSSAELTFSKLRHGTLYQIGLDEDGLLRAGTAGKQLTWMDAKYDDWVITPRIGKPVEIQALWINALLLFKQYFPELADIAVTAQESFKMRFWLPDLGFLADVVDVDHQRGTTDISLRPNQILALGGLPVSLLPSSQALQILKLIEHELLTPFGLRTLSSRDSRYHGSYSGDQKHRDAAYHQGTVWPWLLGPFIEAWLRTHGTDQKNRAIAYRRFLHPLIEHSAEFGGHIHEIYDGNRPHHARGAPFQAWSIAEICRVEIMLRPRPEKWLTFLKNLFSLK